MRGTTDNPFAIGAPQLKLQRDGDVHCWVFRMVPPPPDAIDKDLSLAEKLQALAIPGILRTGWICGRLHLRRILALYCSRPAGSLTFARGPYGKPSLEGDVGIHFNVTRAKHFGAIAVSRQPVGVDAEELPQSRIRAEEKAIRVQTTLWTAYEALAKARGNGLHGDPAVFDLRFSKGRAEIRKIADDLARAWQLHVTTDLSPLIVTVAIRAQASSVSWRNLALDVEEPSLRESSRP